jgi:ankyrin repeat protein
MAAVSRCYWDTVKTLIAANADLGALDHDGRTILDYAAEARRFDMVELLVSKGARPISSPPSPK